MFLAINPLTNDVLCEDYQFRRDFRYGTGNQTPRIYKTMGGAQRASCRLGEARIGRYTSEIAKAVSLLEWNRQNPDRPICVTEAG